MSTEKEINAGGINGLGQGLINTNSTEFQQLRAMIQGAYQRQPQRQQLENRMLSIRFQMESYLNAPLEQEEYQAAGEFLRMYLRALDVTAAAFAQYIGYEKSNLSALMNGRRKINPSLAIKLGRIFKVNPVIWLHLEVKNELTREQRSQTKDTYHQYSLTDLLAKVA